MKYMVSFIILLLFPGFAFAESIYVSSIKTSLYTNADRKSGEILQLKKGDELNLVSENDGWIKVTFNTKTGWVQKLFTSRARPGEKITLFGTESKRANIYARKRASSDVTAASARGLMANDARTRGKNEAKNNYRPELLTNMEKIYFPEDELIKFLKEGEIIKN